MTKPLWFKDGKLITDLNVGTVFYALTVHSSTSFSMGRYICQGVNQVGVDFEAKADVYVAGKSKSIRDKICLLFNKSIQLLIINGCWVGKCNSYYS